MLVFIIWLVVMVLMIAGMWKVFSKAGEPGWAAIVPIYNIIVLLKIAGKPMWWLVMILIVPVANIVFAIMALAAMAARFGKGGGFVAGLIFLPFVFYPILGFGDAQYTPPTAPGNTPTA